MTGSDNEQLLAEEMALREAIDRAYSLARRYVYDQGLREHDPRLRPDQEHRLTALAAAETELAEFRAHHCKTVR